MGKAIANIDRTMTITPQTGATPGTPIYTQTVSKHHAPNGKGILINQITWTVTGCTKGVLSGGGSGSIQAISLETVENKAPLRLDDEGTCSGTLTGTGGPQSCSCKYKITNAGQTTVEAK
jgi:hypothetical protein